MLADSGVSDDGTARECRHMMELVDGVTATGFCLLGEI